MPIGALPPLDSDIDPDGVTRGNLVMFDRMRQLNAENLSLYELIRDKAFLLTSDRLSEAIDDPKKAEEIQTIHLFRLTVDCMKIDAQARKQEAAPRERAQNVLMIVKQDGLPPDRQAALLERAFREMGGVEYRDALAELVGPEEADKRLAIEQGGE